MPSLLENLNVLLADREVVVSLAARIGGSEADAESAVGPALARIIDGLATLAADDAGTVRYLIDRHGTAVPGDLADHLAEMRTTSGNVILDRVFGAERGLVVIGLASGLGLAPSLVGRLLPLLAPIVAAEVASRRQAEDLDEVEVAKLLGSDRRAIAQAGVLEGTTFENRRSQPAKPTPERPRSRSRRSRRATAGSLATLETFDHEHRARIAASLTDTVEIVRPAEPTETDEADEAPSPVESGDSAAPVETGGPAEPVGRSDTIDADPVPADPAEGPDTTDVPETSDVVDATVVSEAGVVSTSSAGSDTMNTPSTADHNGDPEFTVASVPADEDIVAGSTPVDEADHPGPVQIVAAPTSPVVERIETVEIVAPAKGSDPVDVTTGTVAPAVPSAPAEESSAPEELPASEDPAEVGTAVAALAWLGWAAGAVVLVLMLAWLLSTCGPSGQADEQQATVINVGGTADAQLADRAGRAETGLATGQESAEELAPAGPGTTLLGTPVSSENDGVERGTVTQAELQGAVDAILRDSGVSGVVSGELVTLTGTVADEETRDALEANVSVLLGVAAIDNRVILAPAEAEAEAAVEAEVPGETADTDTAATEDIDADATVEADVEADVEASTEATGSSAPLDTSVPAGSTLNAALALAPVSFDSGSPDLTAEGLAVVERVAAHLTEHPNLAVEIGGHTDDDGDENANMELSQQRADAVRTALIDAGIAAERLTAVGYGEAEPIVDNTTADNKARNRRIVFTVA